MSVGIKLSSKIYGGFALVLTTVAIVAAVGWYSIHQVRESVGDLTGHHMPLLQIAAELENYLYNQELAVSQYALHKDQKYLDRFNALDKGVDAAIAKASAIVKDDEDLVAWGWLKQVEIIDQKHDELLVDPSKELLAAVTAGKPAEEVDRLADKVEESSQRLKELIDSFIATNSKEADRVAGQVQEVGDRGRLGMAVVGGGALLAGSLLAFLLCREITRPIRQIIDRLDAGAGQVQQAASQVSWSSQSLAEGSSEQASSIEETSASLEAMSAMTRRNAEHAGRADALARENNTAVERANQAMAELTLSMQGISEAGAATQKIIKTIDEIAFQTNLLALNAAVEAARAGEAGAGFAVVAEEVRSLARRAAEAARSTAELIEGTLNKTKAGSELVTRTNQAFADVLDRSQQVVGLVSEIATASHEQAQGIDQVNQAMNQIDKVTQSNAASAEESAAASEELNGQSVSMQGIVGDLVSLVEGRREASAEAPAIGRGGDRKTRLLPGPA